jgi:hypothetical protein
MKAGTELHLVIRLNSTDEFVGAAGLHPADGTMLETGIWIEESAQGHGYGREAVAAVIKWAARNFDLPGFYILWSMQTHLAASLPKLLEARSSVRGNDTNPATRSGNCCSTAYPCPSSWRGAPCYGQSPCFCRLRPSSVRVRIRSRSAPGITSRADQRRRQRVTPDGGLAPAEAKNRRAVASN